MKKKALLTVLLASAFILAGCGNDPTPVDPTPKDPTPVDPTPKDPTPVDPPVVDPTPTDPTPTDPTPAAKADGAYSYVYSSGEERTKILGVLEKYAVENKLTGLTLYGDGGYVMYSPDVQKGTNTYIPGYGFGAIAEGRITADLAGESNAAWKRYYHTFEVDDPKNILYMNDKGSVVGDLVGYVSSAYYDTEMSETGDSYDWVADQSLEARPIPVNPDARGYTATYKIPVRVGADFKYATTSEKYASFNGREVQLEDYITPYKVYYTQAYGMARGAENLTGSSAIKGSKTYYAASKKEFVQSAWDNIGIKAYVEGGVSYLEFTFEQGCTPFYAMYYLASSMFAPVPEDFLKAIGGGDLTQGIKNWGVSSSDKSESIVDHWLSTGPFVFERWDEGQQIVFKKNAFYHDRGRYQVDGVHFNILTAAKTDKEAALKEFLANKIHSCGVPSTKLEEYKNDPRTTMTSDSSTYKLNLNTCTQDVWEELFGESGTITQTPIADYWQCEPAMANKDFVSGLSFAIDRKSYAESLGRTPTVNYFGSTYMQDPEAGISYNTTDEHKAAVAGLQEGTDGYGYSLEKAKASFKAASDQLIADGTYKAGDTIELEIAWQESSDEEIYHNPIAKYITDAWNACGSPLKIDVKFWVGAVWSDVYYNKMMLGQFDIGFGSISGNSYNPLNFLEVLKSDNSSGFTLNWGLDTNVCDGTLVYDQKAWSFDALWTAADQGAYVVEGTNSPVFGFENCECYVNANGEVVVEGDANTLDFKDEAGNTLIHTEINTVVMYGYLDAAVSSNYAEVECDKLEVSEDGKHFKATFSAENAETFKRAVYAEYGYFGFDIYYAGQYFGVDIDPVISGSYYPFAGIADFEVR